jgi:hypothetical protein
MPHVRFDVDGGLQEVGDDRREIFSPPDRAKRERALAAIAEAMDATAAGAFHSSLPSLSLRSLASTPSRVCLASRAADQAIASPTSNATEIEMEATLLKRRAPGAGAEHMASRRRVEAEDRGYVEGEREREREGEGEGERERERDVERDQMVRSGKCAAVATIVLFSPPVCVVRFSPHSRLERHASRGSRAFLG